MTQHEHVGGGSSNSVAIVALTVLVILVMVAMVVFGGLSWLRDLGGGGGANPTSQPGATSAVPTVAIPTVAVPTAVPSSLNGPPAGAAAGSG